MQSNRGASGRPAATQIQLNKRIMGARDADNILAIVEAEHGEFDAVNAATACSRLAKARRSCANGPSMDERRVRLLLATVNRLAPRMTPQAVASTVWALERTARQPDRGAGASMEGGGLSLGQKAQSSWKGSANSEMEASLQELLSPRRSG